jgi:hypothetical protein
MKLIFAGNFLFFFLYQRMFEEVAIPVSEDTVEYHVYFPEGDCLRTVLEACTTLVNSFVGDYLWQVTMWLSLSHPCRRIPSTCQFHLKVPFTCSVPPGLGIISKMNGL